MENIVLGRILKAMQKLSGRSVGELADEAGLTVDTVNNLFYARVQKPSFSGVCSLAECMGFSLNELMYFLREPAIEQLDVEQITELIAAYTNAGDKNAGETNETLETRRNAVRTAKERIVQPSSYDALEQHNERVNELHEKQLDRFKATHLGYVEQLKKQYEAQLAQTEEHSRITIRGLEKLVDEQRACVRSTEERCEKQLNEMHTVFDRTLAQQRDINSQTKKTAAVLTVIIGIEAAVIVGLLMLLLR